MYARAVICHAGRRCTDSAVLIPTMVTLAGRVASTPRNRRMIALLIPVRSACPTLPDIQQGRRWRPVRNCGHAICGIRPPRGADLSVTPTAREGPVSACKLVGCARIAATRTSVRGSPRCTGHQPPHDRRVEMQPESGGGAVLPQNTEPVFKPTECAAQRQPLCGAIDVIVARTVSLICVPFLARNNLAEYISRPRRSFTKPM